VESAKQEADRLLSRMERRCS